MSMSLSWSPLTLVALLLLGQRLQLASGSGHASPVYASYSKDLSKGYQKPYTAASGSIKSYGVPTSASAGGSSLSSTSLSSPLPPSLSSSFLPSPSPSPPGRLPCKLHHPAGPQFFLPRAAAPSTAVLRPVYSAPAVSTVYWVSATPSLVDAAPVPSFAPAVDAAASVAGKAFYGSILDPGSFSDLPFYQAAVAAGGLDGPGELAWVGQGWTGGLRK